MFQDARAERRSRRVRQVATLALWCVWSSVSCSLVIDKDATQCTTDGDCARFAGTVCVDRACVDPAGQSPAFECTTHQDCVRQQGDYHICRQPDRKCVALRSPECATVSGDYTDEGAIFIGSLLTTTGQNQSFGKPAENSIRLALSEFTSLANGLPPAPGSTQRRQLVLIGCNDADDPIAAATHLTADLHVPAIIGASFSGVTIKVATDVTIPAGTLLISPSATSVAITHLQDDNLVWRTAPSDTLQANAISQLVDQVEGDVRTELGLSAQQDIKLAVVHKGDAYGKGLADTLEPQLTFNGKHALDNGSKYMRRDYGDPSVAGSTHYDTVIADVLAFKPHILLLFGTSEAVTDVFGPIEQQWPASTMVAGSRPRYIFSDGGLLQQLSDLVAANDDLRKRILGTVPGTANDLFKAFQKAYSGAFTDSTSPDVFGTAGAYDSAYLLAYSIVASGAQPITGATIASGFSKLVPPGTPTNVGGLQINGAFGLLTAGQPIDFNGASGPLDFDLATGEAPSDIQVWCLPRGDAGAGPGTSSGLFYNAATGLLEGSIQSQCE